jgi:hypothetical protein
LTFKELLKCFLNAKFPVETPLPGGDVAAGARCAGETVGAVEGEAALPVVRVPTTKP